MRKSHLGKVDFTLEEAKDGRVLLASAKVAFREGGFAITKTEVAV